MKRILVVDDVRLNRLLLGKLLSRLGYEVVYGCNGWEAVDVFQRTLAAEQEERERLFCVLMDINMPSCDGLQATQLIRRLEDQHQRGWGGEPAADSPRSTDSSARRVPIIAVSACSETDQLLSPALAEVADPTERPWRACGMDCFLDKPVNQAKLRLALSRLEAGAPLPPELPPCGEACCAPGGRGLSQPDGLSQPAGSLRPLGAEEAANCLAAVHARPGFQQVARCGLGASVQRALAAVRSAAPVPGADSRAAAHVAPAPGPDSCAAKRAAPAPAEPRAAKRACSSPDPACARSEAPAVMRMGSREATCATA